MIPAQNELKISQSGNQPSRTYKINLDKKTIKGYTDEIAAVQQAIYKILNTERYQYLIYSWNYGIELSDLIGKPMSFVYSEVQRRITEALLQDERIISVTDFSFEIVNNHSLNTAFIVHTIFGDITTDKAVNI